MRKNRNFRWRILSALLILQGTVWAGPPFTTDDPEPVDYQHIELYIAGSVTQSAPGTTGNGQIEFNYGVLPEVQLHAIVTGAFNMPKDLPATSGPGDSELGIKYRFLDETPGFPQIGVFPLVELPTGDASQGLGAGQTQFFLPLWIQKSWGPWTSYGGGGYWINPGAGNQNWVFLGWEIQRDLSSVVTLGGELFYQTSAVAGGRDSLGGNVGIIVNRDDHDHLLLSIGRDLVNPVNTLLGYAAYQWTY